MKVAHSEKARVPGELFNRYLALLRGSGSKAGVDVPMLRRLVRHTLQVPPSSSTTLGSRCAS